MDWIHKPIVMLGLLVGFNFALAPAINLHAASVAAGTSYQIFESYILLCSSAYHCLSVMLGLFLMLSDAPFMRDDILHVGLRVSRRQWMAAQCAYVLVSCFVYCASILIFTVVISAGRGYVGNLWSNLFVRIAQNPDGFAQYGLHFASPLFLYAYTPFQALGISFLSQLLYGFVLSMGMFLLNLTFRRGVGTAAALVIHQIGYILMRDGFMFANQFLSLMVHALPALHNFDHASDHLPTIGQSGFLGLFLALLLIGFCFMRAKYVDFLGPDHDG